ncbi:hypothetical protein KKB64_01165 [Patescibacteria group bacterium]|nr:hypothetical protein [Patescibacteria group bacterium]MBU1472384.1 hypothetical protein [Patescibacteria group bacterium]MBU2459868.1 hypothetical protein [Patescibacteria group bacterium]
MQSQELPKIFDHYPQDAALFHTERDFLWKEKYKTELQTSVNTVITALDLDKPWEDIHGDPAKEALANGIWSTILACNGPQLDGATLVALNKERFGAGYVEQTDGSHFTSNHLSVSGALKPLDSEGNTIAGPLMFHHMPTFATQPDGKPTIGDVSPITLIQKDDKFILSLVTAGGHTWQKQFNVYPAAAFATHIKDIASPCASTFQVTILRPTCQEYCTMCTVSKGDGFVSESYKEKVLQALDVLIDHAASTGHAFQQTLSGGMISSGDGGFSTAHACGLEMIAEKVAAAEQKYKHNVKVQLQLEMVLPPDKSTWKPIVEKLYQYVQKGWNISLAVNIEILHDAWEGLFLQGEAKGASTVADHLAFAKLLSEETAGKIQMNSLVMFGLKPAGMSYSEYMAEDIKVLKELIAAGIKPDYQPVKIESGTAIEAYPPPIPMYLLVQDLALKHMIVKAKLPWSPGCVGSCNACDQSAETKALLIAAKKQGIAIPELVASILDELGPSYKQVFQGVFYEK